MSSQTNPKRPAEDMTSDRLVKKMKPTHSNKQPKMAQGSMAGGNDAAEKKALKEQKLDEVLGPTIDFKDTKGMEEELKFKKDFIVGIKDHINQVHIKHIDEIDDMVSKVEDVDAEQDEIDDKFEELRNDNEDNTATIKDIKIQVQGFTDEIKKGHGILMEAVAAEGHHLDELEIKLKTITTDNTKAKSMENQEKAIAKQIVSEGLDFYRIQELVMLSQDIIDAV